MVLYVFFLLFALAGCQKQADRVLPISSGEVFRTIGPTSPPDYLGQELIDNSGPMHNFVVDNLYQNVPTGLTKDQFAHYLSENSNKLLVTNYGFTPLPQRFLADNENEIIQLLDNNYFLLQKKQMDSIINLVINGVVRKPGLNRNEASLLLRANSIFDLDSRLSETEAFDLIIARANAMLKEYYSFRWGYGEGNAVGGFLNIAKSSAEYWKSKYLSAPAVFNGRIPWYKAWGIPQFDAAGYLYGWGKAWAWDELNTPGKRIKAGLTKAADWSGIAGWFK